MTIPDPPDPREQLDRDQPGGLVESGAADIPGVQDQGPADADEEAEGTRRFGTEQDPEG